MYSDKISIHIFIAILILSSSYSFADIVTNLNSVGRNAGSFQIYQGRITAKGTEEISRATCWVDAGVVPELRFSNCKKDKGPVNLSQLISEFISRPRKLQDLLNQIFDNNKKPHNHIVSFSTNAISRNAYTKVIPTFIHFYNRVSKKYNSYKCKTLGAGVQNSDGGCKTINGTVFGQPEFLIDRLSDDTWANMDLAYRRCKILNVNGYTDWRLPTIDELAKASEFSELIGFNPYLYYWTSSVSTKRMKDYKNYELGNKTINFSSESVLIGFHDSNDYYPFDPIRHIKSKAKFGTRTTHKFENDRKLFAVFDIGIDIERLYRPSLEKEFEIRRHWLRGAVGEITSETIIQTSEPDFIENESYDKYWGQSWGSYPVVRSEKTTNVSLGDNLYHVNPLELVRYELPEDINKDQIGVICVR